MGDLHKMMARWAAPGRLMWIGLRPARRGGLVPVKEAMLEGGGLVGDHARPGKRAVTLMQAEHLSAIASYLGRDDVMPQELRRNLVVAGVNLAALKGREVRVGAAVVALTTICAPCSRMEETFGAGGYSAVRGHGGWCARVVTPGVVRVGDRVCPID